MSDSDPAEVTEADLAELERLEQAASINWSERKGSILIPSDLRIGGNHRIGESPYYVSGWFENDLNFAVAARNALPRLLAEVRRERAARREGAEAGLREALEFYADEKAWQFSDRSVMPPTMPALYDSGKRARAALARPAEPDRATESERDRLVRERDAAREVLRQIACDRLPPPYMFDEPSALYLRSIAREAFLAQSGGGGGKP